MRNTETLRRTDPSLSACAGLLYVLDDIPYFCTAAFHSSTHSFSHTSTSVRPVGPEAAGDGADVRSHGGGR